MPVPKTGALPLGDAPTAHMTERSARLGNRTRFAKPFFAAMPTRQLFDWPATPIQQRDHEQRQRAQGHLLTLLPQMRSEGRGGLGPRQQPPCLFDVKDFHHLAVERGNATALGQGGIIGGNHRLGCRHLVSRR